MVRLQGRSQCKAKLEQEKRAGEKGQQKEKEARGRETDAFSVYKSVNYLD